MVLTCYGAPHGRRARGQEEGFRFQGYFRSGFGVAGTGDPQEAFRAPNAGAKYRLGNETEAYLETIFGYGVRPKDDSTAFFDTRDQHLLRDADIEHERLRDHDGAAGGLRGRDRRVEGAAGCQLLGRPAVLRPPQREHERLLLPRPLRLRRRARGCSPGRRPRASGRRLARRLGQSSWNRTAACRRPGSFQLSKNTFDLRLYGLPLAAGTLGVAFDLALLSGDTVPFSGGDIVVRGNTGWAVSALHERRLASGRNKLSVQYGTGVAYDFRAVLTQIPGRPFTPGDRVDYEDVWQFRAVEDLVLDRLGPLSLQLGAVWQELDNGLPSGNRLTWVSLGVRPAYHFSRYFSLELEAGFDHTRQTDQVSGSLMKVTLAPQITPGIGSAQPAVAARLRYLGRLE